MVMLLLLSFSYFQVTPLWFLVAVVLESSNVGILVVPSLSVHELNTLSLVKSVLIQKFEPLVSFAPALHSLYCTGWILAVGVYLLNMFMMLAICCLILSLLLISLKSLGILESLFLNILNSIFNSLLLLYSGLLPLLVSFNFHCTALAGKVKFAN